MSGGESMIENLQIYESDFWNKQQVIDIYLKINEIIDKLNEMESLRA